MPSRIIGFVGFIGFLGYNKGQQNFGMLKWWSGRLCSPDFKKASPPTLGTKFLSPKATANRPPKSPDLGCNDKNPYSGLFFIRGNIPSSQLGNTHRQRDCAFLKL